MSGHIALFMGPTRREDVVEERVVTDAEFRRIFDMTSHDVRRFCIRRLPPTDVNDAVSEVYLVAWRRAEKIPAGDEALLWLYAVARNVVRSIERRNRRSLRLVARASREPTEPSGHGLHPRLRRSAYR